MLSSIDATESEQYGPVSVDLQCDFPGAEVLLVDGQQRLIGRGLQELKLDVLPGVYTARVVIGDALRDERIIVRPDKPFSRKLGPPLLRSAIPLDGSATSHEFHQKAVSDATTTPETVVHDDGDSRIFVVLREWTSENSGRRDSGPLAPKLMLWSDKGDDLHTFNAGAESATGDRAVAEGVRVRAGFYRLACQIGDGVIEMPVYALKDWHTQIYLLSQPGAHGLAPDFDQASVLWALPNIGFDPGREDLKVLESVRFAAAAGRQNITDKGIKDALYQKFSNPMLGLVSAHALFQRRAIDTQLLTEVTNNLEGILGLIPDVIALKLAIDPKADVPSVLSPPILRWSWELLLQRSVDHRTLIPPLTLAEQICSYVIGGGIWLSWLTDVHNPRLGAPAHNVAREAAAKAVRQVWVNQIDPANLKLIVTPEKRRKSSVTATRSMQVKDESTSDLVLRRMVQTLGVPCSFVEEAVGTDAVNTLMHLDLPTDPAEQPTGVTIMNLDKRKRFNERFLQRLLARRPQDRPKIEQNLQEESRVVPESALADLTLDPTGVIRRDARDIALETIVNRERPVLFVRDGKFDLNDVTALGPEAQELVERMRQQGSRLFSLLPLIGRIDVVNFPNIDFVGTGWFVDTEIVVTNRHVASLIARWDGRQFAFSRGVGGQIIESSLCNAHEFDDLAPDASRIFKVKEVLYIEPENGPNDIAFLKVERRTSGNGPSFISVAPSDAADELPVCVVGYPARAPKRLIPDQDLMKQLYRDRFDVKRAAPGFTSGLERGSTTHDCTTLGGNSGSVVLDLATGQAVGLHYAGIYEEDNFAVRASVLTDYIKRKRWNLPPVIETQPLVTQPAPAPTTPAPPALTPQSPAPDTTAASAGTVSGSVSITIPLTVTFSLGAPQAGGAPQPVPVVTAVGSTAPVIPTGSPAEPSATGAPLTPTSGATVGATVGAVDVARVEEVLPEFWNQKPEGVLAVRVGFFDTDDGIGDAPCIAASVKPSELGRFTLGGPALFRNVPIRYLPADVDEQVQALPTVESVDSIAYDDDARTGERFSFAPVNEQMDIILHVGPEYSWDVLKKFIDEASGRMVSAMYEFHAPHIKDAIEARLKTGTAMTLVLDNATFARIDNPDEAFDRVDVFENWGENFTFNRIVAPEGTAGLISDSYHIKVTVRDDDKFWLSSGNWKAGSSQPLITQEQRDNAANEDLPGNREWHVVIKNKKLASRFRNHILQDFSRSEALGGGPVSPSLMEETLVDVPIQESALVLERRPPNRILPPKSISRKVRVRPLLTPDQEGAIYSEAVLDLIQSAQKSLFFQIPYIGMPSNPQQDRGFIDELIRALTGKLKNLDDAKVILRSGGKKFSAPTHAAWFFKSKGVDIDNRLRVIENHHTKGMIVDGRRVLIGSHNWSKPGVTLNRDASLLFDDAEVAQYYTEAFMIDWERSNKIKPRRFVTEGVVLEAVGDAPPPGFQRVRLADLVKDDD